MTVSYLITVYNKESFVADSVNAALADLAQTGGELIIYDDASTDCSAEIVQQCIAGKPNARLIRGDKNRGVAFATNYVIKETKQPFTRLIDGDDMIVKGSTAQLLKSLKQNNLGFIHGAVTEQGDNDHNLESQPYDNYFPITNPLRQILRRGFAGTSCSLFNTADLRKTVPLPEHKRRTQDFLIILRMARSGARMGHINDIVAVGPPADRQDAHLSASLAAMFAEMNRDVVLEGPHLSLDDLRYASRRYAARAAKYFRRVGQIRLSGAEKRALWLWQNFAWMASRQACLDHLGQTADMLERDRHTVILN